MPLFLKSLLASRKFWIALFGVTQSVVFALWPNFPQQVWMSIDALCIVLIGAIAHEDASTLSAVKEERVNSLRGK